MTNPHTDLIHNSIKALSRARLGIFWVNETGAGFPVFWDKKLGKWRVREERVIKYGLVGSSDIIGIVHGGYFFAGECKTGTGVLSPEQINFKNMILKHRGIHVEIREPGDAVVAVKDFLRERL